MIINIKAEFACDNCGTVFHVGLDPAYQAPATWTTFEVAEDAVRGGIDYEAEGHDFVSSVQDGKHLCGICTRKLDMRVSDEASI